MSLEAIKLSEEELTRINALRSNVSYNIESIGRLYLRQKQLEREIKTLDAEIEKALTDNIALGQEEESIISDISSKYGEGSLNLETGEYNPYPQS
jgi:ABC-type enterochelin transport system substrate-binding protein